ncbi:hypothetical protein APB26_32655 [Pseudomonas aeruginosa]|uniref:hypothetical protein n=1 Tax=Pseudomonas aeruginosa TaxID=287 RepID=UPI00071C1313|nr:hypothetical protein [Pseudomonas aeruginosa]KSQ21734.1 hypothetical protein APB26_32655 [Pseudomonas aeruginosa]RPV61407.1 hypothetical protein IPC838_18995 [Pseudomonas aeruginosa]
MKNIRVLFNYTESVIPPGCRKPRQVTKPDGEMMVGVPVLDDADAPVAIRATGEFLDRELQYQYELRWWNDQLWAPLYFDNSGVPRSLSAVQGDWQWPELPEVLDLRQGSRNYNHKFDMCFTFGVHPIGDVQLDILHSVGRHAIIDGRAHRAVPEPRYLVMTFGLGSNHGGTSLMVESHFNRAIHQHRYFGLLEFDAALEEAGNVAKERGDTDSLPMQYFGPKYEVLMPEVISVRHIRKAAELA